MEVRTQCSTDVGATLRDRPSGRARTLESKQDPPINNARTRLLTNFSSQALLHERSTV